MATQPRKRANPAERNASGSTPARLNLPHLSARSTEIRTLVVNAAILALFVLIVPVVASQFWRSQVLIEPIAVPARLAASGLTPEVAANRLWDGLQDVVRAAGTGKDTIAAIPDSQKVDFSIPDSGLSIDSLVYYVRQFFNAYETRVSGEFRCADPDCAPEGISLRLRIVTSGLDVVQLPPMQHRDEAQYFREAASGVLAILDPFTALAADANAAPDRAKVAARRLIRTGHKDAKWAHNLLGIILLRDDDEVGALAEFRAALALDPHFLQAWANLGDALRISDDHKGAREAFETLEKADPGNGYAAMGFADLALAEGKIDEAIALLLAANEKDPLSTVYLARAGQVARDAGDIEQAEAYWQRALELDPGATLPLASLALQRFNSGQYGEAARLFGNAADFAPLDAATQGQHAELLMLTKDYERALSRSEQAIALAPENAAYRMTRASALQYLDRHEEALSELEHIRSLEPRNPRVSYAMAMSLRTLRRPQEAVAAFNEFLALDPDSVFVPVVHKWIEELAPNQVAQRPPD